MKPLAVLIRMIMLFSGYGLMTRAINSWFLLKRREEAEALAAEIGEELAEGLSDDAIRKGLPLLRKTAAVQRHAQAMKEENERVNAEMLLPRKVPGSGSA